jgi:hypothetical protein
MLIHDGIENVVETVVLFETPDIFHAASGEIVEDKNGVAPPE